jgi:quinol-cytochrome oxidoreductase complex cytochrome b subunit
VTGFFGQLVHNLVRLPRNLVSDLRPLPPRADQPRVRMRRTFTYHMHPRTVNERSLNPLTTFGLGIASLTLFICLCISGALLMLYYLPSVREAYGSMLDIQHAVRFGAFFRALHRWAAHGMVVTVCLHLLRVLYHAAYRRRELNWFLGLGLMALTLGLSFTGYLLPWDQRSFWAVTVSASMLDHLPWLGAGLKQLLLGGSDVGAGTLLRCYMLHVALLPTGLLVLFALHAWRIRRDGGLAVEKESQAGESVSAWPHLVLREGILVLVLTACICAIALWVLAPLGSPIDAHHPANPEKAPWYFVWLQEMVSYSALVGGVIFPAALGLLLALVPFLDREDAGVGRWFGSRACRLATLASALLAGLAFLGFEWLYLGATAGDSDLFNPATGMLFVAGGVFVGAGALTRSTRAACQGACTVLMVAVLGFVFMGWCRGPDWAFFWPWEAWPLGL